jgi:hypothetical protein
MPYSLTTVIHHLKHHHVMGKRHKVMDKKMQLIGLCGAARSGKSTVAGILKRVGYAEYAIADPLKRACQAMFGFTDDQIHGDSKDKVDDYWKVSPRYVLQRFGTEIVRVAFPRAMPDLQMPEHNIHLSLAAKYLGSATQPVVISDVRFRDEVEFVKERGGILVHLSRHIGASPTHESEADMSAYCDYRIINDGTIDQLADKIMSIVSRKK